MKKVLTYTMVIVFAITNIFGSCEEDTKKDKIRKKARVYLDGYKIYNKVDSDYTNIKVYVGIVDKHKYRYHLFDGKNKSQMFVEHLTEECKTCKGN